MTQMMLEEDGDMDLEFPLNYFNQPVLTRLIADSGAGANAIDIAYVPSKSISELVWTPDIGLTLKFVEGSNTDKTTSSPPDVGPSNKVISENRDDKPISERKSTAAEVDFFSDSEAAKVVYFAKSPRSSAKPVFGSSSVHHPGQESQKAINSLQQLTVETAHEPVHVASQGQEVMISDRIESVDSGTEMLGFEIASSPKLHIAKVANILDDSVSLSSLQRRKTKESAKIIIHSRNTTETLVASNAHIDKPKFSFENALHLVIRDACLPRELRSPTEKAFPLLASGTPSNSIIHHLQGNGKQTALFCIDYNESTKDEDPNHESAEGCDGHSLFLKRKSQQDLEPILVVGSKRIKNQICEAPSSPAFIKKDTYFKNLISNRESSFSKSNEDEHHHTVTFNHRNGHESHGGKGSMCHKTCDIVSGNFLSIVQSSSPGTTFHSDTRITGANCTLSGVKELVDAEKICPNLKPPSLWRENNDSGKHLPVDDKNINLNTFGNGDGLSVQPSSQPQIVWTKHFSIQKTLTNDSSANKRLSSLERIKGKDGGLSSATLRCKEHVVSSDDNPMQLSTGNKDDPRWSSWIGHFSSKHFPSKHLRTHVILEHTAPSTKCIPQCHDNSSHHSENLEAKDRSGDDTVNAIVNDASAVNYFNAGTLQLHKANELYSSMCIRKETHSEVAVGPSTCDEGNPLLENGVNFSSLSKGLLANRRFWLQNEVQRYISSSCKEVSYETQIPPLCISDSKSTSDVSKMFDAIRRLRLSRMDLLKWMNPHSLPQLNGFFLRLRLRNREGVCGSGYHVACINEKQTEMASKDFKNSINVSVGGIRCLVEGQYVSNHDFSEDELMTYWNLALRTDEIPTEEYLKSKFEERQRLGY